MKTLNRKQLAIAVALLATGSVCWFTLTGSDAKQHSTMASAQNLAKPALTVTAASPKSVDWPVVIPANGNVVAWQEAVISSELGGLRLAEVLVNVGDVVKRGQVMARFASETVQAELALQEAAVEEAHAALFEADANVERAKVLDSSGALSAQQILQFQVAQRTTRARLASAQARLRIDQIRMRHTQLIAPDDGVLSSRSASVGTVTQQGQELFKLIRRGQLEWRAELASTELARIHPGQVVHVEIPGGVTVTGKVRVVAPTVDLLNRNGVVYVDLAHEAQAYAGLFASGKFELHNTDAMTVPQSALVTRDGYQYVFRVGTDNIVHEARVTLGRRMADRVEVITGIAANSSLVVQGAGFLADGDLVKVVGSNVSKLAASAAHRSTAQ